MKKKIIAGAIIGVVLLTLIAVGLFRDKTGLDRVAGDNSGEGEIGIIHISGVITTGGSSGGFTGAVNAGSQTIISQLQDARENPQIKAVVLYINSPGGSAAGSLEIGNEIRRLRKAGKKVVAYMADSAASGAYWISCETDTIVANPATMTGSIGVIMRTTDLQGLYDMVGIDNNVFKSGPHKDMGSEVRDVTEEEREIFQSMINDIYDQFLNVVSRGRDMDMEQVKKLADGRVFTGRQALEKGLVDELGDMHKAVQTAADMAGIEGDPSVVNLSPRTFWDEFLTEMKNANKLNLQKLGLLPDYGMLLLPEHQ
ncbi:MAG: signal peptide peptidase SppA [Firmicutes bacterium]|nr:signal peptide peptidase SppA [Bacillota bacterium]